MIPTFLIVWFAASFLIALAGRRYRFGFWGYLFGSLLLTPIIGLLMLIAAVPVAERR